LTAHLKHTSTLSESLRSSGVCENQNNVKLVLLGMVNDH
jgi:hypothetical protein